jgi:hypothetical protein
MVTRASEPEAAPEITPTSIIWVNKKAIGLRFISILLPSAKRVFDSSIETLEESVSQQGVSGETAANHYTRSGIFFASRAQSLLAVNFDIFHDLVAKDRTHGILTFMLESSSLVRPVEGESLTARVRAGDSETFAALVRAYLPVVRNKSIRL